MSFIELLNSDDEDGIWEYKSQSRLFKKTSDNEKCRLSSTQIKKEPNVKNKEARTEPNWKKQKRIVPATNLKQKVKEETPRRIKCEQTREGRCPLCQMPFSLLSAIESSSWHIDTCIAETPTNSTEECPKGDLCDSVVASHYKKFKHTQLARSESKRQHEASSNKFGNVNGAKSKLNFDGPDSNQHDHLAIPSSSTGCIINLVDTSSDEPSDCPRSGDNSQSTTTIDNHDRNYNGSKQENSGLEPDVNFADELDGDIITKDNEDLNRANAKTGDKMAASSSANCTGSYKANGSNTNVGVLLERSDTARKVSESFSVSSSDSGMSEYDESDFVEIAVGNESENHSNKTNDLNHVNKDKASDDKDHDKNNKAAGDSDHEEYDKASTNKEEVENGKGCSVLKNQRSVQRQWSSRLKGIKRLFESDSEQDDCVNSKEENLPGSVKQSIQSNTTDLTKTNNDKNVFISRTEETANENEMVNKQREYSGKQKNLKADKDERIRLTLTRKGTRGEGSSKHVLAAKQNNKDSKEKSQLCQIEASDLSPEKNEEATDIFLSSDEEKGSDESMDSVTISQMLGSPGSDGLKSDNKKKEDDVRTNKGGKIMQSGPRGFENLSKVTVNARRKEDCTGDNNDSGYNHKSMFNRLNSGLNCGKDEGSKLLGLSENSTDSSDLEIIGTTISQPFFSQAFKKVKRETMDDAYENEKLDAQGSAGIESVDGIQTGDNRNKQVERNLETSSKTKAQECNKNVNENGTNTGRYKNDESECFEKSKTTIEVPQQGIEPENSSSSTGFFSKKLARLQKQIQSDLGKKWSNSSDSTANGSCRRKAGDMYSKVKKRTRLGLATQSGGNSETGNQPGISDIVQSAEEIHKNVKDRSEGKSGKLRNNNFSDTSCTKFKGLEDEVEHDNSSRSSYFSESETSSTSESEDFRKGKSLLGKRAKSSSKGTQRSDSHKNVKKEPSEPIIKKTKHNDVVIIQTDNESTDDATDYQQKRRCCLSCLSLNAENAKKATCKSVKFNLQDEINKGTEHLPESCNGPSVEIENERDDTNYDVDNHSNDNNAISIKVQKGDSCQTSFISILNQTTAQKSGNQRRMSDASSNHLDAEGDKTEAASAYQDKSGAQNIHNNSKRQITDNSLGSQNLNNSETFGSIPSTPRFEIDNICTLSQNTFAQLGGGFIPEGEDEGEGHDSQKGRESNQTEQDNQNSENNAANVLEFVAGKVNQIQKNAAEILMASRQFLYGNMKGKGKKPAKMAATGSQQSIRNFFTDSSSESQNRSNSGSGYMPGSSQGSQGTKVTGRTHWLFNKGQNAAGQSVTKTSGHGSSKTSRTSQQEKDAQTRKCPFYKKIPGTCFTVDAFRYGLIPGCKAYFLTHFHGDHYAGLTKKFTGHIYCTKITGNLVHRKIGVSLQNIHTVPLDSETEVDGVKVTFIEANHCPGAVLILFKLKSGKTYLHTGDFRASPAMENHPALQNVKIHDLYLDTTYCDPQYDFPSQEDVITQAVQLVMERLATNPNTLIVCGSYTIGKERIFTAIADALDCDICVTPEKKTVLDCLKADWVKQRVKVGWGHSRLHVLTMNKLNSMGLEEHLKQNGGGRYTHIMAIEPTGWSHSRNKAVLSSTKPKVDRNNVTIYALPYSEHSSFLELKRFIQFTRPDKILPTVNNGNVHRRRKMEVIFDTWRAEIKSNTVTPVDRLLKK